MSRPAIPHLSAGATTSEALSLLHQRLLVAEEQTEALIRDMSSLGVSREQLLGTVETTNPSHRLVTPLRIREALMREAGCESTLWRQCDSLVSRVCRMESLLQTLKLTTFRLQTERELDPSHTAGLKQQLAALQQESEEEQRASRREAMKLREQLEQACQERDEARTELQRLGEMLEVATAAKMDVALAAEELKVIKEQMNEKLMEMKEQMCQESACSFEAMKSHSELLLRVEEMEKAVEMERRQAQLVQSDHQALYVEVQTSRRRLQEEQDTGRRLQERCHQLQEQTEAKDSLVSELKAELKNVRLALQKQQTENSKLQKEGGELRTAADKVQALNNQLESQCSELSSALRLLTAENAKQQSEHQTSLKAERSRVVKQLQEQDLLLEAARRNIQAELQVALSHKVSLQMELEKLKAEHAQLLQSSSIGQETAVTQKELLECTIERLRGELSTARRQEEAMRKERQGSKNELCLVVTKLEGEKSALETQLSEAKREGESLSSALQRQEEENRRLMGKMAAIDTQQQEQMLRELTDNNNKLAYEKGKLQSRVDELQEELTALKRADTAAPQHKRDKLSELQAWQGVCGSGGSVVSQTLENILASHSRLQLGSQTLQEELGRPEQELLTLRRDRLQTQREIRKHQAKVDKLQELLSSTHSKNNKALKSSRKALDTAKVDNKRLAKSLEQAVSTSSSLQSKLEQARDQHRLTITLREEELHKAQTKIGCLSKELDLLKHRASDDNLSSVRALHREISELRKSYEDSSARSGDLSRANWELRQRVTELERIVSNQKARIREQKSRLKQQVENRATLDNSERVKILEESVKKLQEKEETNSKLQEARTESQQALQASSEREAEWERWASTIQRWETKRELARIAGGHKPGGTLLLTRSHS
ncbi:coiled-coil domain-containing protein 150 isoform X2 [Myripristis murdjan]|uniref:coiled-coil domain-containing protein 150 isoform X2 n=1 Tax=Myripristis murdjan TaxID=586833 RepID=UPI001175FFD1|nr:coiled-coil domain-containing protein 150-like isoform X2 [Myripristis murdjan]